MYKVNYQYASPSGDLRSGSFVFKAKSAAEAKTLAEKKLNEKFGKDQWWHITNATELVF